MRVKKDYYKNNTFYFYSNNLLKFIYNFTININNKVNFIPVFGEEILFSFFVFLTIASYIILFRPLLFMHPANFEQANPLVTPPHIVPE